ncbi:hypothetical protein HPP92_001916 [Vanilla planifolia]|uniref:Protein ZIP4 homolog n=1 Tax=Vanilla planifolia TaxID=51239 RepID=A0A835RRJ4_VANPL|nr:hypothetical protein HPP92_001916 [Vanilla planifolia]
MRISELSPEIRISASTGEAVASHVHYLDELESLVKEVESLSHDEISSAEKIAVRLRKSLSHFTAAISLSYSSKVRVWKLSYRIWNACVDLCNASNALSSVGTSESCRSLVGQAELRQISSELLLLAGNPQGIPSPAFKCASFFYRTGLIWHDLGMLDRAAANFERATDLTSSAHAEGEEEKRLLLDLSIARARTAWEANDCSLAIAFLGRSKSNLFGSPTGFQVLAEQYLQFGKICLRSSPDASIDVSKLLSEALDLCEKGISISTSGILDLERLKVRCLRFMAAERLQVEDYEGVLRCVRILRGIEGEEHPSVGYVAMKAWIGAGRMAEAEKELKEMMTNKGVPEIACVTAAEAFLAAAGVEAAKSVMLMLLGRCRFGAGAALRVLRRVAEIGGSSGRARVAAELASDERVIALFDGSVAVKERNEMHALLWNWGAEHFRSKDYKISSELFEKSMLYVPRDEEHRTRRANCFRVLSLCHLALAQLDQAQEFIDQAEKLEPNVKCSFLKFKIQLQKEDEEAAINQIQAMLGCIDFNPEFLTLCSHEAIACQSFPVAVASLSVLLNLYSPGRVMPMQEVAVFRNLIALLHRNPESEQEILKCTRRAQARMTELGSESFFGKGAIGTRELGWFAGNTWNMGLKMGNDRKYKLCAEFFELAADFFSAFGEQDEEKQMMVCKSLILCTGAMLNAAEEDKASMIDSDVKKAVEMLHRAEKILPSMLLSADDETDNLVEASNLCFLHTFNTYQLLNMLDEDSSNQQLQLTKSFASTKACKPHNLLHIGLFACQGRKPNPKVAEFCFSSCLSSLLSSPTPDFQMVSIVLRKLICLANLGRTENKDEEAYTIYRQAYQIIVGLKEGEYPMEEGKWLAMTAWNKSGTAVRLGQVGMARKWMKMGLDLGRRIPGMENYIRTMEECFAKFEAECGLPKSSSQAA